MKPAVFSAASTFPNYAYDLDGTRHIACMDCLPDLSGG
jgi:hypothetical protein